VYARCKSCTQPIPLDVGTTLQQKLKGSPQDITEGRSQAKKLGPFVGRYTSILARGRECGSITAPDKAKVKAYYRSMGQTPASVTLPKSAAASVTLPKSAADSFT
jgi:hypothetical protein